MTFTALRTGAFRNLADREVDTQSRDVFLVGENGQGKTNFLEALYFSAYGSSFRGSRDEDLIRSGESSCAVRARLGGPVHSSIQVKIDRGRKSIELDGKALEDRKELLQVIPCIVFCHEDMEFVSGPPETRRRFFDQTQSLYDSVYLEDLRRYRKVLKMRNALLRQEDSGGAVLDSLDAQLIEYGLALMSKREEAARQFSAFFGALYEEVSGIAGIAVRYAPSWRGANSGEVAAYLASRRDQERMMKLTLSGPHRDRYLFMRKDAEFSGRASTGQRRLLALLLRTAQAGRFSRMTGRSPVLLLDDALLELDPEKRRKFLAAMPEYDQAFYTFLPEEPYERYRREGTLVYRVQDGVVEA